MSKLLPLTWVALAVVVSDSLCAQTPAKQWPKPTPATQTKLEEALKIKDPAQQIEALKKALAAAKAGNDLEGQAESENDLGKATVGAEAAPWYESAVTDFIATGNTRLEAGALMRLGNVYLDLGKVQQALEADGRVLALARKTADSDLEGKALNNIGQVCKQLGRYDQALDYFDQSVSIFRKIGNQSAVGIVLGNTGGVYLLTAKYEKALDTLEKALVISRETHNRRSEGVTLSAIGAVYDELGQPEKALEVKRQSLTIEMEQGNGFEEMKTLTGIGNSYVNLGQYESALDYFKLAVRMAGEMRNSFIEGLAQMDIGFTYARLNQQRTALSYFYRALSIVRDSADKNNEAKLLTNIGSAYRSLGQNKMALKAYSQALPISRQVGDRKNVADTLDDMSHSLASQKLPGLAIVFAKQSVNTFQLMRKDIQKLSKSDQDAYVKVVEPSYRHLASLLIKQGRLREAEKVMNLLKEEENFEFVARNEVVAGGVERRIEAIGAEEGWWNRYQQLQDKALKIDADEFDLTQQTSKLKASQTLTAEQKAELSKMEVRLKELDYQKNVLDKAADAYFEEVGKQAAALGETVRKEAEARVRVTSDELPTLLRRLHRDSRESIGAVYALASADELDFLIVTYAGMAHVSVPVKSDALNTMISALRKDLMSPVVDPRPRSEKLYHLVFEKLIHQLHSAGCTRVVWCLDGTLRYVPMGALWDGKQYLLERDDFTMFDPLHLDRVSAEVSKNLQAAGFAATQGKGTMFAPLPGADKELKGVVKDDSQSGFTGAVPGRAYEDKQFDEPNLVAAMKGDQFSLLHIATHFNVGKDFNSSSLLLGDGNLLSLRQFTDAGKHGILGHLDLVCLSACDTAESFGDSVSAGSQFSSFVSLTLNDGASSVIASLWPVSDASTPLLMKRFYEIWMSHRDKGKAEALRTAQLSLLHGESASSGEASRSQSANAPAGAGGKPFVKDPMHPFSHPYYWAPFILFGNWK